MPDELAESNKLETKEYARLLEPLTLPQEAIYIDVNGTLIAEEESGIPIFSEHDLARFQSLHRQHLAAGRVIGLNSDSPLEMLQQFGLRMGLTAIPVVAENGNVVGYNDQIAIVNPLADIEGMQAQIRRIAQAQGIVEGAGRVSPEFGGLPFHPESAEGFGFGKGRIASVSVFGAPAFIEVLGRSLLAPGCTVDCSAEYGFFAVHPGNYRGNKGRVLAAMAGMGKTVHMIGNSSSDRVDPSSGARFYLVDDPKKTNDSLRAEAAYVSGLPTLAGVNDILERLLI